jgi:iron(III) transport system substrate-binding protein
MVVHLAPAAPFRTMSLRKERAAGLERAEAVLEADPGKARRGGRAMLGQRRQGRSIPANKPKLRIRKIPIFLHLLAQNPRMLFHRSAVIPMTPMMEWMMTFTNVLRRCTHGTILAGATMLLAQAALADEVNIYTTREPGLIQPLLDAFTKETGIETKTVALKDGLAERVATEGAQSPADILMTVDIGNLVDLVEAGVTQPVDSQVLNSAIPANLRDPDGNWFALSLRARVVYADKDLTDLTSFTYEDLADPKWQDQVCIRSGKHPYNIALIATMIAKDGAEKTEAWLRGVKNNLARPAAGGDRDVARDILGDICEVGIGNSYYVGLMRGGRGGPEQEEWGQAIKVILPTFADGSGTQVNVSGAAVAKNAPNRENAIKLLEFLVSDEAQGIYASANYEYPVKPGAPVDPIIEALGPLKVDATQLTEIAQNRKQAAELVDKVGFDD